MNNRDIRWVIVGELGLYTGQWLRRCDAIAAHTSNAYGVSQFVFGHTLSPEQAKAWAICEKRGDRVIKAEILWSLT